MTVLKIEPILPKLPLFDLNRYKSAIEQAGKMTAEAIKVDFEVTTATWEHQVDFKIDHAAGSVEWKIYTKNAIYGYVSEGTKPHTIRPRGAKRLHFFRTGFRPKTRVEWIGSNKGRAANKDETFAKAVQHPGTQARKYPATIKKKWDKEWGRQLARAIRAAAANGG
jgi:hypothetical protein